MSSETRYCTACKEEREFKFFDDFHIACSECGEVETLQVKESVTFSAMTIPGKNEHLTLKEYERIADKFIDTSVREAPKKGEDVFDVGDGIVFDNMVQGKDVYHTPIEVRGVNHDFIAPTLKKYYGN